MDKKKRDRLEAVGWQVGSTEDFLGLSPEEMAFVDMKIALARTLRRRRQEDGLTQEEVASRVGSSQSRVAKMEAADPSVSLDLLVKTLLAIGTSPKEVGEAISSPGSRAA